MLTWSFTTWIPLAIVIATAAIFLFLAADILFHR